MTTLRQFARATTVMSVLVWAQPSSSQPTVTGPPAAPGPTVSGTTASGTTVSGVTVTAHRSGVSGVTVIARACPQPDAARYPASAPPQVVDTYPAQGAVVAPGPLTVRVTFDAPMACYFATVSEGGDDGACTHAVTWDLPGRTTLRMSCNVVADANYKLLFGGVQSSAGLINFVGLSGREARPYVLRFKTAATPVEGSAAGDPGPPRPERVLARVVCTDQPLDATGVPCTRKGVGVGDAAAQ